MFSGPGGRRQGGGGKIQLWEPSPLGSFRGLMVSCIGHAPPHPSLTPSPHPPIPMRVLASQGSSCAATRNRGRRRLPRFHEKTPREGHKNVNFGRQPHSPPLAMAVHCCWERDACLPNRFRPGPLQAQIALDHSIWPKAVGTTSSQTAVGQIDTRRSRPLQAKIAVGQTA